MPRVKICGDLRIFWRSVGKKMPFWSKTVFHGQEVHYYMVNIAYFTELNLQIWEYAQKRRICREICKYALDENFHGHFCPRRKAAKFCHPGLLEYVMTTSCYIFSANIYKMWFHINEIVQCFTECFEWNANVKYTRDLNGSFS